jgi:MFS family permease
MGSSTAQGVQRTYLLLTLLSTLAASFIWGINTLFLLDAGLSNTEAFAANAFFTLGEMLFEIPTGVVADTWGRRTSYLLGAATLLVSTLLYVAMWKLRAPFWAWAGASMAIGLGFTFFSGATEAWLVDALAFTGHKGKLDDVLARGQVVTGVAMLSGTVGGGFVAQLTNLGVPYMLRAGLLGLTLVAAAAWMKDLGFTRQRPGRVVAQMRGVLRASLDYGFRQPGVRWVMLAAFCSGGVSIYGLALVPVDTAGNTLDLVPVPLVTSRLSSGCGSLSSTHEKTGPVEDDARSSLVRVRRAPYASITGTAGRSGVALRCRLGSVEGASRRAIGSARFAFWERGCTRAPRQSLLCWRRSGAHADQRMVGGVVVTAKRLRRRRELHGGRGRCGELRA